VNNWKKGNQEKKIEKIRELSIQLFEKKEKDLEQKIEQGVIDFKTFILEQYYIKYKDRKDELKILFNLINKFLKTEVEEIGIRIYKYFYSIVNIHYDKIGEINIRAYTEFLIYINENSPRIIDIWHNNINSKKNEKKLIKNSIDLLGYFSYNVLYSYQNYNKFINENKNIQQYDYLLELKIQNDSILEKITKAIYSIKIIEKEDIDFTNEKDYILFCVKREIANARLCKCENVVELFDSIKLDDKFILSFELCETNLFRFIKNPKNKTDFLFI
jgi:hypothetical protein